MSFGVRRPPHASRSRRREFRDGRSRRSVGFRGEGDVCSRAVRRGSEEGWDVDVFGLNDTKAKIRC